MRFGDAEHQTCREGGRSAHARRGMCGAHTSKCAWLCAAWLVITRLVITRLCLFKQTSKHTCVLMICSRFTDQSHAPDGHGSSMDRRYSVRAVTNLRLGARTCAVSIRMHVGVKGLAGLDAHKPEPVIWAASRKGHTDVSAASRTPVVSPQVKAISMLGLFSHWSAASSRRGMSILLSMADKDRIVINLLVVHKLPHRLGNTGPASQAERTQLPRTQCPQASHSPSPSRQAPQPRFAWKHALSPPHTCFQGGSASWRDGGMHGHHGPSPQLTCGWWLPWAL